MDDLSFQHKRGGRTSTAFGDVDSTFDIDGTVISLSGFQHWTGQLGLLLAIAGLVLVFQRSSHLKLLSIATAVFAALTVFFLIPEASLAGTSQIDGSFGSEFGSVKSSATIKSWFEPGIGAWVYSAAAAVAPFSVSGKRTDSEKEFLYRIFSFILYALFLGAIAFVGLGLIRGVLLAFANY